jgi:hypothetical protein
LFQRDYNFTLYDAFGDGFCCTYGSGYFKLYLNDVLIHDSGSTFTSGYQQTVTISVNTRAPTIAPTTPDTVNMEVSFELTSSSAPSTQDENALKVLLVTHLKLLDESEMKRYLLEYELETSSTSSLKVLNGNARYVIEEAIRYLTSGDYTWMVSFGLVVSLSDTKFSSSSAYSSFINRALSSSNFTNSVSNQTGAVVDVSSLSVSDDTRGNDDDDVGSSSIAVGAIVGITIGIMAFFAIVGILWMKQMQAKASVRHEEGGSEMITLKDAPTRFKEPTLGTSLDGVAPMVMATNNGNGVILQATQIQLVHVSSNKNNEAQVK